jgi:hypothetical protein
MNKYYTLYIFLYPFHTLYNLKLKEVLFYTHFNFMLIQKGLTHHILNINPKNYLFRIWNNFKFNLLLVNTHSKRCLNNNDLLFNKQNIYLNYRILYKKVLNELVFNIYFNLYLKINQKHHQKQNNFHKNPTHYTDYKKILFI